MLDKLDAALRFQQEALNLRAQRQEILAANIANADTPGFQARDIDFSSELKKVMERGRAENTGVALALTSARHIPAQVVNTPTTDLLYRVPDQPSLDGNTVDMDRERTQFADNSLKNIFAIGGNPEAAKVSGVNVGLNLLMIYALSGVFYAFGGMLEAGRIGSATNNLGFMYELDAIAACVVGGVSFSGGVGTVLGVVTGVIIFTVINYGLTYIGVNPYWQYIIKGGIIIFAVALDSLKYARKK
jgi:flagellar basal-body rod protein FlgB